MEHDDDEIYLTHWYPYTYTDSKALVSEVCNYKTRDIARRTALGQSLAQNTLDLIIITNFTSNDQDIGR